MNTGSKTTPAKVSSPPTVMEKTPCRRKNV